MSALFDRALQAKGPEYLRLELDLRRAAQLEEAERDALRRGRSHSDAIARLLATVILDWGGPKREDFSAALAYLDRLPVKLARTAMGTPSPTGTESYLTLHFGDRVAELLALRLVKEEGWPSWKTLAVVFYLTQQKAPSTTPALLRFAIDTPNSEWRGFAVQGLQTMGDRDLAGKAAVEIARAQALKRPVPAEVRALGE